ncbi:Intein C-terminal splicing region [uncultured Caudovirales phage]|uniref:Intein C-terminal splicing region n=1 Tax=uncultured Caudovirales phage TaxID=2100421 RepID=A0A6J5L7Z5_9CAUD|nr:Intein C-terminal splicing region [uncultured Caudovirales phage]
MLKLSDLVTRKFTDIQPIGDNEWSVQTDSGWQYIQEVKQTVPYQVHNLTLTNGLSLECADTHIVFNENMDEVFVKDLTPGEMIQTERGLSTVDALAATAREEQMYDLAVDSPDHRFYSNGILSHNSTCAAGYLLWYAMFVPNSTILVAAHKYTGSQEIMQRIRFAYENCPDHIKAGCTKYNQGSLDFENGSRIVSATTTENTGRGMSISLLYCLDGDSTTVKIRHKETHVEETVTLAELYGRLGNASKILT